MTEILRRTLRDISAGCTFASIAGQLCYVRHLGYADQIGLEDKRTAFFNEAKTAGVPTDAQKSVILKKQGLWSDQKELDIAQARQTIIDLSEAKRKNANMPSLVEAYVKRIEEAEIDFAKKEMEKRKVFELTCESFADRSVNDYYIISNLFCDKDMNKPLFTEEQFDLFTDEKVSQIVRDYNSSMEGCSEKNVKRLAMQGFFQKYFQLVGDNITSFFGRPVCQLTNYQVDLLRFGALFKSIYQNHDISTFPPESLEDPDLLIDNASAITKGKQEMAEKGANDPNTTVFGLKSKDRKALGIDQNVRPMSEMFKLGR